MKHLKKLISLSLATLLAFTCYVSYKQVSAEDANVDGHFYVANTSDSNSDYGWSYDDSTGVITISQTGDYTISKACSCSEDTVHYSYSIVIGANITVNLTIEDINIENTSGAAMDIDGSSTVILTFKGDNSFTSASQYAGIQFNNATGSLTITSDSIDNTLTVKGGNYAAGIGSIRNNNAANITISGGTVIATGGNYAAGIGGGQNSSGSNITITGGTVIVNGGDYAAGIGCGYGFGLASNITISGGTVTATGGTNAAGIGAGVFGSASDITISCGTVKASSISITPQSDDNKEVSVYTIVDVENVQSVTVDGIDFNISSNHPDDNNLYLYLTDGEHEIEIIAGNKIYEAVWNDDSQSYELQYVKDVETSTGSGTIIVDTSTR